MMLELRTRSATSRRPPRPPTRRRLIAATALVALVLVSMVWFGLAGPHRENASTRAPSTARATEAAPSLDPSSPPRAPSVPTPPLDAAAHRQLEALRAMPAPSKAAKNSSPNSSQGLKIPSEARQQPDLYAAAFATALLTQDYRTPRADLLDAIAAEGTTTAEPLVVGLVPTELRDRLPVFSVTDTTTGNGVAAVPDATDWSMLAARQAYTTVEDVRVSEPIGWTNAVQAGRITDPGITARDVTATVTLHQTVDGHPQSTITSVAFTANFEGPPTLPTWRFVTLVQYTAIQTGQTGQS